MEYLQNHLAEEEGKNQEFGVGQGVLCAIMPKSDVFHKVLFFDNLG